MALTSRSPLPFPHAGFLCFALVFLRVPFHSATMSILDCEVRLTDVGPPAFFEKRLGSLAFWLPVKLSFPSHDGTLGFVLSFSKACPSELPFPSSQGPLDAVGHLLLRALFTGPRTETTLIAAIMHQTRGLPIYPWGEGTPRS
jgi:hypothetical protein